MVYIKKVYLAMAVLRNQLGEQDYFYYTVGPMIGTIEGPFFINHFGKKYPKMTSRIMGINKSRFAYYNEIEVTKLQSYFSEEDDFQEIVKRYIEYYQGITYYVYLEKPRGHFVLPVLLPQQEKKEGEL